MDVSQSMIFVASAADCGFVDMDTEITKALHSLIVSDKKSVRDYRTAMLSAALIHDGVDLLLPRELHSVVDQALAKQHGFDILVDYGV